MNDAYVAAILELMATVQAQKDAHSADVDQAEKGIVEANGQITAIQAQAASDCRPAQDQIVGLQSTKAMAALAVEEGQLIIDGLKALVAQVSVAPTPFTGALGG